MFMAHGLSCSVTCGIFPDQDSNLCLLHWQADCLLLSHQGCPNVIFLRGDTLFMIVSWMCGIRPGVRGLINIFWLNKWVNKWKKKLTEEIYSGKKYWLCVHYVSLRSLLEALGMLQWRSQRTPALLEVGFSSAWMEDADSSSPGVLGGPNSDASSPSFESSFLPLAWLSWKLT